MRGIEINSEIEEYFLLGFLVFYCIYFFEEDIERISYYFVSCVVLICE